MAVETRCLLIELGIVCSQNIKCATGVGVEGVVVYERQVQCYVYIAVRTTRYIQFIFHQNQGL